MMGEEDHTEVPQPVIEPVIEPVDPSAPAGPLIERAAAILRGGGLVAFPTETVYGLGADACNDVAVARLYEAKGRPSFNPLIAHVADRRAAAALVSFDERARRLAESFWPGPLTLVLPRTAACPVSLLAGAGLPTLAVRVPAHPVAHALLSAFGGPVVAPSANRSGGVSPTRALHVAASLGDRVDLIIDGGPCEGGLESTIVDLSGATPRLLRPGLVTREAISALVGPVADDALVDESSPASPGQLSSHYAPAAPVRLDAADRRPGEAFVAFGPPPAGIAPAAQLSAAGDLVEAAANLFAVLHALDAEGVAAIAVAPIPDDGLGRAINDRLRRAAAPRTATGR